jgi:putative hemolysin
VAKDEPAVSLNSTEHIVDLLIRERAPRLAGSAVWPILKPILYGLLNYAKARRMADTISGLSGHEALEHVSNLLNLEVEVTGLEHLPKSGRLVIVANHPTGIADGIAVFDALKVLRPDLIFYANSDAHRVCPRFDEVLIPVEWVEAKRTRERTRLTLTMTKEVMEAERALMVFPAGRLARRGPDGRLREPEWMPTAISVARKYNAPIVPVHLQGPWSTLFHAFDKVSPELRDITLFHELLNKRGQQFSMVVGEPIDPQRLDSDSAAACDSVKAYLTTILPASPNQPFA